ncbi:unnamed protein product [Leptosia nina]|uniref:Uncharacterized protein n=1 Tax=Leptosia nina TaxID=320188 RepID=A0AAV1K6B7_9NEOP
MSPSGAESSSGGRKSRDVGNRVLQRTAPVSKLSWNFKLDESLKCKWFSFIPHPLGLPTPSIARLEATGIPTHAHTFITAYVVAPAMEDPSTYKHPLIGILFCIQSGGGVEISWSWYR